MATNTNDVIHERLQVVVGDVRGVQRMLRRLSTLHEDRVRYRDCVLKPSGHSGHLTRCSPHLPILPASIE